MIATDRFSRAATRRVLGWTSARGAGMVALLLVFSLLVTSGVALMAGPIEVSGWHRMAATLKVLMLILGVMAVTSVLPQHLAHGRTRREFTVQWALAALLTGVLAGALTGAGFALEGLYYGLLDWPQRLDEDGALASPQEVWPLVAHYMLVLPTWIMAAALVFAGFAHRAPAGWGNALVAVALVIVAETTAGQNGWSVAVLDAPDGAFVTEAMIGVSLAGGAGTYLAAALLTWLSLRTAPLRSRAQ